MDVVLKVVNYSSEIAVSSTLSDVLRKSVVSLDRPCRPKGDICTFFLEQNYPMTEETFLNSNTVLFKISLNYLLIACKLVTIQSNLIQV